MNGFNKNSQSISQFANQLIRYYKVPFRSTKTDALNAVLNSIKEKEESIDGRQKHYGSLTGVSAAAVAAILVAFWIFTATITKSTSVGEVLTYRLPDESRIVLQENSTVKFKKYYWNRKVKLNGEAYFEVKKGEGFQVISSQGKVEVLGTRFLVSDQGEQLLVQCFEGRVKTSINKKSWILAPHTSINSIKNKTEKQAFDENKSFPEFATFSRQFTGQELKNVIQEIESFFNVEIVLENGTHKKFSGSIHTGSLESTLQIISASMQMKYHLMENNRIIISD